MKLFNHDAEQAVLGAVLLKNSNVEILLDQVTIECFNEDKNKAIYSAMVELYIEDRIIDTVTLIDKVTTSGHKISSDYIYDISEAIINLKNFENYVQIIHDLHLKRALNEQCNFMMDKLEAGDVTDLVYNFQDHMLKKMDIDKHSDVTNVKDKIQDYINSLGNLETNSVQTGFKGLNDLVGGFNRGDVVILAGRPGLGKTSIALNMFVDMAERGNTGLFFSLEQPEKEMIFRMTSSVSGIDYARLKKKDLFPYEFKKLSRAVKWISSKNFFIDDTSSISIPQLKAKIRKTVFKHKLDVVFIDYIQLMSIGKGKNRFEGVGEIARELKNIAKELNVVVVALSQLNRDIEKRGRDAKPLLSDLRESGDIEQIADYVFFVDRDFYDPASSKCDLVLAKNRHGSAGTIKLVFKKDCFRFFNVWKKEE